MPVPWLRVDFALWGIFLLVWAVAAPFSRKTVRKEPIRARLRYGALGAIAALLLSPALSIPLLDRPALRDAHRAGHLLLVPGSIGALSVCLTALGVSFAIWARFTLGRNWSGTVTVKENHTLVQNGPYALVRHPIYTGIFVGVTGMFLGMGIGPLRLLLGLLPLLLSFRFKMATEERFMTEQFGEAYGAYRRRVKALIPFLW